MEALDGLKPGQRGWIAFTDFNLLFSPHAAAAGLSDAELKRWLEIGISCVRSLPDKANTRRSRPPSKTSGRI